MARLLLDHLWQSTLFALGAWALALGLRNYGARVRYKIWLAASIKFLVPFSLLAAVGVQLRPLAAANVATGLSALRPGEMATRLVSPAQMLATDDGHATLLALAAILWALGCVALVLRWHVLWRHTRAIVRMAVPADITATVPVLKSALLREPGVVGVVRPILLIPADLDTRLDPKQLESIVGHEMCHVRNRDNLTAAIHMIVEALFWFHPLVWWIGARMLDERERACDEAVVRAGNDPRDYAEGILKVCRSYVASDLACVAGVSGADLKSRLEAIMTKNDVKELRGGKKTALAVVAFCSLAAPVLLGAIAPASLAQAAEPSKSVGKIALLAGKRVKLDYQNVDVRSLLKAMAEAAQVNLLVSDQVSGHVTVKLEETTWEHALDIILASQGLVKHEQNGILIVEPGAAAKG
jgi:bla regulator protein BlaR1